MDEELEKYSKLNSQLRLGNDDLRLKWKASDREKNIARHQYQDSEAQNKNMRADLQKCADSIQDVHGLKVT